MEETHRELIPAEVPTRAKQGGETQKMYGWVEPGVWTERMLATLEKGVKGGKWFSLIDKVESKKNLEEAAKKVIRKGGSAGVDRVSAEDYRRQLKENIEELHREIKEGIYEPKPVKRVMIPKGQGKWRPLGIPVIKDRVAQTALRVVIEPIFEKEFMPTSYGFRPGRGCKEALKIVTEQIEKGNIWIVDADIKSYFDSIPHGKMMKCVEEKIADGRILEMVEKFLKQGVMDGMKEWAPEEGTPQGAVISPLLANIYLHSLDREMAAEGYQMVRYADDFVVLCGSEKEAREALERVEKWMLKSGLTLSDEKTRIVDMGTEGQWIEFLGYHIEKNKGRILRWPRKKSLMKMKEAIREKTRRCNGHSLSRIIQEVNAILRGWFGYYKQSHWTTYGRIDQWVRMRLRSVLRKRAGRSGIGHGWDNVRWPNAYFEVNGFFSMVRAWESLSVLA